MDGLICMEWTNFKGKKVYIITKKRRTYSGVVKDVITQGFEYTIYLIDKYGKSVMIHNSEIAEMKED